MVFEWFSSREIGPTERCRIAAEERQKQDLTLQKQITNNDAKIVKEKNRLDAGIVRQRNRLHAEIEKEKIRAILIQRVVYTGITRIRSCDSLYLLFKFSFLVP